MLPFLQTMLNNSDDPVTDGAPLSIRRNGLKRVAAGSGILGGIAVVLLIGFGVFDSPAIDRLALALVVPPGVGAFCWIVVGLLQAMTGRTWNDNPEWVRLLALVVFLPATFFVAAVLFGVIAHSI